MVATLVDHSQYGYPGSLADVATAMTEEQEERLTLAFEQIAANLGSIARTMEVRFQKDYPLKKPVRDADITYIPTEEERLREEQGQTGERTTEDWTSLGPRERKFVEGRNQTPRNSGRPGKDGDR